MKQKDIFHECVCTGQKMTEEEWTQWVTNHSNKEIVHRCGEFEYNINDICLNPRNIITFKDNFNNRFEIETCQIDNGKWSYGVGCWFGTQGWSYGASFTNATHNTEKAAVYVALQELEKKCSKVINEIGRYGEMQNNEDEEKPNNISILPKLKAIKKKIGVYKEQYNPMVLNLFGW